MGIGIARYYNVYDNTTNNQDYWASAVSPPPKNTTSVKECGFYIAKEKDESDRVWVPYTTYKTYHFLCKNHMSEYREHSLSKKKGWKFTPALNKDLYRATVVRDM